jgi:hypothetical protein
VVASELELAVLPKDPLAADTPVVEDSAAVDEDS